MITGSYCRRRRRLTIFEPDEKKFSVSFKLNLINNTDHIHISSTEPSSAMLSPRMEEFTTFFQYNTFFSYSVLTNIESDADLDVVENKQMSAMYRQLVISVQLFDVYENLFSVQFTSD